jgi:hypothetical protein
MDPARLIPASDPLPVPWGWFQILLLLTFVLHLLFMNTMLGTGIIALVSHLKNPKSALPVTADISKKLPYTIAFTVNMGVPPLLFLQVLYGHLFYVSSVLMAGEVPLSCCPGPPCPSSFTWSNGVRSGEVVRPHHLEPS